MKAITTILLLHFLNVAMAAGLDDYAVVVSTKTDSATFTVEKNKLKVTIRSTRGIGGLEVSLKNGAATWPENIVLSLQSKGGNPLRELEGLTLSGKTIRISGSRRTSGRMDCHDVAPEDAKIRNKNARKVNVLVEKTAKAMVVTIPGKLLKGERSIKIHWVDFYR